MSAVDERMDSCTSWQAYTTSELIAGFNMLQALWNVCVRMHAKCTISR